jgi:hypothetical protein
MGDKTGKGKKAVGAMRDKAFKDIRKTSASSVRMGEKLLRTQMCKSVKSGKTCRHGVDCRYAHNDDQLMIAVCEFGANTQCNRVERLDYDGSYSNVSGYRMCMYKHPRESKEQFFSRTRPTPAAEVQVAPDAAAAAEPEPMPPGVPELAFVGAPEVGRPEMPMPELPDNDTTLNGPLGPDYRGRLAGYQALMRADPCEEHLPGICVRVAEVNANHPREDVPGCVRPANLLTLRVYLPECCNIAVGDLRVHGIEAPEHEHGEGYENSNRSRILDWLDERERGRVMTTVRIFARVRRQCS